MDQQTPKSSSKGLQEIAEELMTAIATGALKPGQRLVELHLCNLLGAKRNKIREALRRLEHDGFVRITPNVGAFVAEPSRNDIEQIYDLLSVLDAMGVRIATPFVTPEQLKHLQTLLNKMEATTKPSLFADYNNQFHTLLCSYSENSRLMKLTENLRLSIAAFGFGSFFAPGQIEASRSEHGKLLQAIKQNKPQQAERIMRKHMVNAKNRLIKWMYKSL